MPCTTASWCKLVPLLVSPLLRCLIAAGSVEQHYLLHTNNQPVYCYATETELVRANHSHSGIFAAHAVVGACQRKLVARHYHTVGRIHWQCHLKVCITVFHGRQRWQLHAIPDPACVQRFAEEVCVEPGINNCEIMREPAAAAAAAAETCPGPL
jgi:hypothetical protein